MGSHGQGLIEITHLVQQVVKTSDIKVGMCTVFIRHTSASLTIQENADPSARRDLEMFLEHLVPEGFSRFTHTAEGPDDMPSHIKCALTASSLSIPVSERALGLGTWQGIYLWEHRHRAHQRQLIVHVSGD